jgi:RNA-directed DNA polymerase
LTADQKVQGSGPQEWEQWHRVTRTAITKHQITASGNTGTPDDTRLVHSHCHRRVTGARKEPAPLHT